MSYDLNILCINQTDRSRLPFASSIELRNEIDFPSSGRYHSIWPFMCNLKGVWYSIVKNDDEWINTMSMVGADFEKVVEERYLPYWIPNEEVRSNLTPLIVYDKYKKDFENIIEFLIQQSPNNTILFLARYQGGETEIVYGVLEYEKFMRLLHQSEILFNVCYVINS